MLTFGLIQVPLGLFLDHWGARKTQTFLFFIGGIGIIVFGSASKVLTLSLGRAILGVGMAAGLMGAFKAVSDWVNKEKIPFFNGIILAAGGLGAWVATTPSKLFEIHFGWRLLCFSLGIITFLIALLILFISRDKTSEAQTEIAFWDKFKGLKTIYFNSFFWSISPLFVISLGGFIGMQGLWLGPWLQHVVDLSPLQSANYLSIIAIGMTLGMLSGGLFSHLSKLLKMPLISTGLVA